GEAATAGLEEWLSSPEPARAAAAVSQRRRCTVLVTADGEDVAFRRALALVHSTGLSWVGVSLPPAVDSNLERLIEVHALARGAVPGVRLAAPEGPSPAPVPAFASHPGPVVVAGRAGAVSVQGRRPLLTVPVERLTPPAVRRMWRHTIPELAGCAADLAARLPLEPAPPAEGAAAPRFPGALGGRPPQPAAGAARGRVRGALALSGGVKLVRPRATFENLVLPADRLAQLREAADRLLHQARVFDDWGLLDGRPGARGVRMLFAGPPGTGKTLSA